MLHGLRVMVLEDEALVAFDLVEMLAEYGCAPMGPFHRTDKALAALENDPPDFAILDVNLGNNKTSEPVANRLDELQIPYAFATGYASANTKTPPRFSEVPKLAKPLRESDLKALLQNLKARSPL